MVPPARIFLSIYPNSVSSSEVSWIEKEEDRKVLLGLSWLDVCMLYFGGRESRTCYDGDYVYRGF
jgi:hypothetical protein